MSHAFFLTMIQILIIIFVSRVIGLLMRRIGQPLVIAEVTAGILIGPSLLGLFYPDLLKMLFPESSLGSLGTLSQVALVLFMFLIGLEFDTKLLRGHGRASLIISHTSIVAPFILGFGLAHYLYPRVSSPEVSFTAFALFIGAAMSITAFPVLARIMAERQMMRTKVGAITITCAAIDDVTAWCILAFVIAAVRADGWGSAVQTLALAIGYILLMLLIIRPFLVRLGNRAPNAKALTPNVVAVVFVLMLISSILTEWIGIHALFGAFMMGSIIPKGAGFDQHLAEKIEDVVVVLMLPLFFALSGLRTQIGLLDTLSAWGMTGLIILAASLGKFGGSFIAARFNGLNQRESLALGILMNTRGLMELIVLNIGYDLGVISSQLFTMMVLMALFTTFITTPILHWVYPRHEMLKELAGSGPTSSEPIKKRSANLMLCAANMAHALSMVELLRLLIKDKEKAYALHLQPPSDRTSSMTELSDEQPQVAIDQDFERLLERAEEKGVSLAPLTFVSNQPARDICGISELREIDFLLMGWHKPLVGRSSLGGTVYEVMKHSRSHVGIYFARGSQDLKRVLVPYQGSEHDRLALELAHRIQKSSMAEVTVLHVVNPNEPGNRGAREMTEQVFGGVGQPGGGQRLKVLPSEDPVSAVLSEAREGYDLAIIGIGANWGLEQNLFGWDSERLIHDTEISLLVVRKGKNAGMGLVIPAPPKADTNESLPK